MPQLRTDPRFQNTPLPLNHQLNLFHSHLEHLRSKHVASLHTLFETVAPSLATRFNSLDIADLLDARPVIELGYDVSSLESVFTRWQQERYQKARAAFDELLSENSFIEFWGRLGKMGGEGVEGGVKADETGEDEGEGWGGKVDMKALAKSIDVDEVEAVLKVQCSFTLCVIYINASPAARQEI